MRSWDDEPSAAAVTLTANVDGLLPAAHPRDALRFALFFHGREGVQLVELRPGETRTVGRAAPADIVVEEPSLSRIHARLEAMANGVLVEDLGSKNGTRLGGTPIVGGVRVQAGGDVSLGNVTLFVRNACEVMQRGFEEFEPFVKRIEDELVRGRTFQRPVSLIMLRARGGDRNQATPLWLRVREELRPVDTLSVYGRSAVLILLPELSLNEALRVAQALARRRPNELELFAGVASFPDGARSAHALIEAARRAARLAQQPERVAHADSSSSAELPASDAVVVSERMQELFRVARRVASRAASVLVLGETGTGKEIIARTIHEAGARRDKPFRALNCGAIPGTLLESVLFGHEKGAFTGAGQACKGVFEQAHGGTLFLDEVGELSLAAQAALLRVLETKTVCRVGASREITVDVRVVAATHCDLEAMVGAGTFRADLFHRLNVLCLSVPPLRERVDEIPSLAEHFLQIAGQDADSSLLGITDDAMDALCRHTWPGNVRELRNVIERAVLLCSGDTLDVADLPERLRGRAVARVDTLPPDPDAGARDADGGFADHVRAYEVKLITEALRKTRDNQKKAAELLRMPLRTLVHKIRVYGLRGPGTAR